MLNTFYDFFQNALFIELNKKNLTCQTEVIVPIYYDNIQIGFERADILVYKDNEPHYVIELKSQNQRLNNKEINQVKKYMINLKCNEALLVNFYETLEIIKLNGESYEKI